MGTLLSMTTLAHAISGSVGSIIAMTLTYPLDRVRTIKQLEKGKTGGSGSIVQTLQLIIERQGVAGLYDGLSPMLVALGTSNFVYFYWFTALKTLYQVLLKKGDRAQNAAIGPFANLLLASIAGVINVAITTPIWRAYTRITVERMALLKKENPPAGSKSDEPNSSTSNTAEELRYSGVVDCLHKLYQEEGFSSLWSGMGPSLILCSNPSIQFASYEWFKKILLRWKLDREPPIKDFTHFGDIIDDRSEEVRMENVVGEELSSYEYLFLGAGSKLVATILTYPLQVAQTRLRASAAQSGIAEKDGSSSPPKKQPPTTTRECLAEIYKNDGIEGWYRGIEAKLVQTCMTSAFMFAFYEKIVAIVLRAILWRKFQKKSLA